MLAIETLSYSNIEGLAILINKFGTRKELFNLQLVSNPQEHFERAIITSTIILIARQPSQHLLLYYKTLSLFKHHPFNIKDDLSNGRLSYEKRHDYAQKMAYDLGLRFLGTYTVAEQSP